MTGPETKVFDMMAALKEALARDLPRVGGIIEDETGAWFIQEVREEEGAVILQGRHGEESYRSFGNLGPVRYEDIDVGDGSNYAEAEDQ